MELFLQYDEFVCLTKVIEVTDETILDDNVFIPANDKKTFNAKVFINTNTSMAHVIDEFGNIYDPIHNEGRVVQLISRLKFIFAKNDFEVKRHTLIVNGNVTYRLKIINNLYEDCLSICKKMVVFESNSLTNYFGKSMIYNSCYMDDFKEEIEMCEAGIEKIQERIEQLKQMQADWEAPFP